MSQKIYNKRQRAMSRALGRGFVPVVWQSLDGHIWLEEQENGRRPFVVFHSHGDFRTDVAGVRAAIRRARREIEKRKALP